MLRDEELVQKALDGSPTAFNTLVERYQARLIRFLVHRIGNMSDAEELTQEVFLKTYLALDRFNPRYQFSTWLYRIAINLSIDFLRKRHVSYSPLDFEHPDTLPNPGEKLSVQERFTTFMAHLGNLPGDLRLLVEMRHFLEMSYNEMAETLDLPLGTVKNRLFRARQSLVEFMENDHA